MTYKWNALWVVSIAVFIAFFLAYQMSIETDRGGLPPTGIKIIYTDDLPISEGQIYLDTDRRPQTIRFESVANVDLREKPALIAVILPYEGTPLDHSDWNYTKISGNSIFVKKYNCSKDNPCMFTENNQFFSFLLDDLIDQKKEQNHTVSLQFLDTAARSDIKLYINQFNPENAPLDNSFKFNSSKVTNIIPHDSEGISPLPDVPARWSESGIRILWNIKSGILHELSWENPVERIQIFYMVFYSAVYGIALAILNLIIFAWSQESKVLEPLRQGLDLKILKKRNILKKIFISILILIAIVFSTLFGAYLSNPTTMTTNTMSFCYNYFPMFTCEIIPIPPTDKDSDGIPDTLDQCTYQPETYNKYRDSDGCPDEKFDPPNQHLTEVGEYKKERLENIVADPKLIEALKSDNEKYSLMKKPYDYINQKEIEWIESGDEVTPFMESIIYNQVSDYLRDNLVFDSENFGEVVFGELILTNKFGANTAITVKSDNFDQAAEDWWKKSEQYDLFVKSCEWDDSAAMKSEDVIIRIEENGEFLGILNSATPCDVLQKTT